MIMSISKSIFLCNNMFLHRFFRGTSGNIEIIKQSSPYLQAGWFRSLIAYVVRAPFFSLASLTVHLLRVVGTPAIALLRSSKFMVIRDKYVLAFFVTYLWPCLSLYL